MIELFLDSSALMAGILSAQGAARALLLLSENGRIHLVISEQVLVEVERNVARKSPKALPYVREMIRRASITIVRDPSKYDVKRCMDWINHPADVVILVSAVKAGVRFLVTLNSRHFLADPSVVEKSGLRIGTPGDALAWVREHLKE